MKYLKEVVREMDFFHCINREGFVFTSAFESANILDAIVIRNPENCDCWSPKKSISEKTLEEHIAVINQYKLKKAVIIAEDIDFITQCPSLEYIEIIPADTAPENFDYSPLYKLPQIRYLSCITAYGGCTNSVSTTIDYSKIDGLIEVHISGKGHQHYDEVASLEGLYISNDVDASDLQEISSSENLKKLWILQCKFKSLDGIEKYQKLQQLSLGYCRTLEDITEIIKVAESLRALHIENCPKIKDFSCLQKLTNLEHLELRGKNQLTDLNFLNQMPKLKTFTFSMQIQNCDLTPCLQVPYVYSAKNKKEYNFKDKELPKKLPVKPFTII